MGFAVANHLRIRSFRKRKTTAAAIGNFRQVVKGGELRMHPIVGRLVDPEVLEKLGAAPGKSSSQGKSESIQ